MYTRLTMHHNNYVCFKSTSAVPLYGMMENQIFSPNLKHVLIVWCVVLPQDMLTRRAYRVSMQPVIDILKLLTILFKPKQRHV